MNNLEYVRNRGMILSRLSNAERAYEDALNVACSSRGAEHSASKDAASSELIDARKAMAAFEREAATLAAS